MEEKEIQPKGIIWIEIIVVLGALILALLYFGKNLPQADTSQDGNINNTTLHRKPRTYSVFYRAGVFSPTNLRIRVGDTVKFENSSLISLRVISDDGGNGKLMLPGLDSVNELQPAESFIYSFTQAGIFSYHNHANELERGTVIVRE
ncbi:MAG: hypothetical protein Q8Q06_02770 [bacterium]|nr:hypothetical protein [bacterium]